jgi:hypothetical protein
MSEHARALIEAMAKHLPPSSARLRLLDVGGAVGAILSVLRADLDVLPVADDPAAWGTPAESVDAVCAWAQPITSALLASALTALRAGGRLIIVQPDGDMSQQQVDVLEGAGYVRILVEHALHAPTAHGVLLRGERAHTTADTHARIQVASTRDDALTDLAHYPSRYLYLLVKQTPNKPVWALREGEQLTWHAVCIGHGAADALLAFSSLAKAVAFMQPAVVAGRIRDINKVAKYSVQTATTWNLPVLLNPPDAILEGAVQRLLHIDPASAEASDE